MSLPTTFPHTINYSTPNGRFSQVINRENTYERMIYTVTTYLHKINGSEVLFEAKNLHTKEVKKQLESQETAANELVESLKNA